MFFHASPTCLRVSWHSNHLLHQITARIQKLCYGLDMNYIDPIAYAPFVASSILVAN